MIYLFVFVFTYLSPPIGLWASLQQAAWLNDFFSVSNSRYGYIAETHKLAELWSQILLFKMETLMLSAAGNACLLRLTNKPLPRNCLCQEAGLQEDILPLYQQLSFSDWSMQRYNDLLSPLCSGHLLKHSGSIASCGICVYVSVYQSEDLSSKC